MITHTTMFDRAEDGTITERDYVQEYRMGDRSWGKYDSGFHAWLVECVEVDEYAGDTDYGGAVLYGRFVDYWDSQGFHYLARCDTREEARQAYESWCEDFYRWEDGDDEEGNE